MNILEVLTVLYLVDQKISIVGISVIYALLYLITVSSSGLYMLSIMNCVNHTILLLSIS